MLTDKQREVITMRYRADLSFREMARLIGINPKTMWRRHYWALRKLERQIGPRSNLSSREPNA